MRFGIREICEVVLRAKATQYLGKKKFYKNEPVLYFDSLKTSSLEGAATTVYATGGRGNTRLVAWEGERTLTFTMEDALISPESFSILSGAGLLDVNEEKPIYVHTTSQIVLDKDNTIVLPNEACWNKYDSEDALYHNAADIFIMELKDGQIVAEPCIPAEDGVAKDHKTITCYGHNGVLKQGSVVIVDYYVKRTGGAQLIEITPDKFGGNYYLEASTLFRDEQSGVDMPAEFVIPNCKVQSNFTFNMAATGDPSTFTFTMDAFPDYTKFDGTHKVLAAIQVITEDVESEEDFRTPCAPGEEPAEPTFNQTATSTAEGATVIVTSDSATACEISVTGIGVKDNVQDDEMFNANDELLGVSGMSVVINIPVDAQGGLYHIKTVNPALKHYPKDNRITENNGVYTKNSNVNVPANDTLELAVLITEETDTATVEVTKGGKAVKTYKITADVTFAEAE